MNSGKIKEAWSARLGRITGCAQAVSDCREWNEDGESGYTLTVPVSTELAQHYLTSCADTLARDANRRVEVHPGPGPGLLAVMVWNDAPVPGTCGAPSRIEPDGFTAYCDRGPFHEDPVDDDHSVNQHHAMIRSRFGDEPQGEHYWDVGPLHIIPASPSGIVAVLEELAGAEPAKESGPHASTDDPWSTEPNAEDARTQQVAARLVAQLVFFGAFNTQAQAEARAEALMDQAAQEIERTGEITSLRSSVHRNLTKAVSGTLGAIAMLEHLESDGVCDVEYAGTRNTGDIVRFVDEARRSLTAALALLPTDQNGSMK
ncbi:hypothetical protein [Streptomyces mirabilis]|uniref:hypothetical protein n=1 Tax=Streptomyces mirabilis TaxID=68239 RepID=UPI0033FFFABE